jgi:hypothetical protein
MPVAGALRQFLRLRGGQTLWTIATGAVPSLSLLAGEPLWIAAALFWAETILASVVVGARVAIRWRQARQRGADSERRHLGEVGRLLGLLVGGFNATLGVIGGGILLIGVLNATFPVDDVRMLGDRLRMLAIGLACAAVYDTLVAPTHSIRWLQSVAAWQWSRTAVLFVGLVVGALAGVLFGERWALWGFLSIRVLTDLGALRGSERERIRAQVFEDPPT